MAVDPKIPPTGEEIHMPGLSAQPLMVSVGITITLIGVTFNPFVCAFGIILTLWVIALWIRDARRDIEELPVHHH